MSWFEHLQKEEVPPEHLWGDAEGLEQWWERVEEKRSEDSPTDRNRTDIPDGNDDPPPGMADNDYARALKQS